jgi:hypothetical protein
MNELCVYAVEEVVREARLDSEAFAQKVFGRKMLRWNRGKRRPWPAQSRNSSLAGQGTGWQATARRGEVPGVPLPPMDEPEKQRTKKKTELYRNQRGCVHPYRNHVSGCWTRALRCPSCWNMPKSSRTAKCSTIFDSFSRKR